MGTSASLFLPYYARGPSGDPSNTNWVYSLGNTPTVPVPDVDFASMFPAISSSEASSGSTRYRSIYFVNKAIAGSDYGTNYTQYGFFLRCWFTNVPAGMTIDIGVSNNWSSSSTDQASAPGGVTTWTTAPTSEATAFERTSVIPSSTSISGWMWDTGNFYSTIPVLIWFRRIVSPGFSGSGSGLTFNWRVAASPV